MSGWIEAQHQYVVTALDVLSSTQRALDEFVHEWRRESRLPVPCELESLQRSLMLVTKNFRQSAAASATHAGNVARQLAVLASFDQEKLAGVHGSLFDTAVTRIEKSVKVIAAELELMNDRNDELRERLAVSDTDDNTREIFIQVARSLDIVAYSYAPLDTRTVGAMSFDELKACARCVEATSFFDEIKKHGEIDETRAGFEQLQRAFQALSNFQI